MRVVVGLLGSVLVFIAVTAAANGQIAVAVTSLAGAYLAFLKMHRMPKVGG